MKRFLFILLGLLALTAMASSEKRPYIPPYTYEKYHITYQVRADGAYTPSDEIVDWVYLEQEAEAVAMDATNS